MELDNEELEATKKMRIISKSFEQTDELNKKLKAEGKSPEYILIFSKGYAQGQYDEKTQEENIINKFKKHCKKHKNFCNYIRKTENKEPDLFYQGKEYIADQFLNLLQGKEDWEFPE